MVAEGEAALFLFLEKREGFVEPPPIFEDERPVAEPGLQVGFVVSLLEEACHALADRQSLGGSTDASCQPVAVVCKRTQRKIFRGSISIR